MGMTAPLHIDMQLIAKELDIWIHFEDTHSMMLKRDGMYSIVLNQKKSPEEQWQDFAHELCHVLKHTGNHFHMNKLFRELQEFQANHFMYHFCVPTFMLLNMELPQRRSHAVILIAAAFRVTASFAEKGWSCLNGVKQVFNFRSGSLVCYPTSGRMGIMKADRHTCMPLKKKRRILLKISGTLRAECQHFDIGRSVL